MTRTCRTVEHLKTSTPLPPHIKAITLPWFQEFKAEGAWEIWKGQCAGAVSSKVTLMIRYLVYLCPLMSNAQYAYTFEVQYLYSSVFSTLLSAAAASCSERNVGDYRLPLLNFFDSANCQYSASSADIPE